MHKHLAKLATLACTVALAAVVGLGSAGAAQAGTCQNGDTSGQCSWAADDNNSPNLTQQNDQFYVGSFFGGCFTGYWWTGTGWQKGAPGEKCVPGSGSGQTAELFNAFTIGQSIHALQNSGSPTPTTIYF